MKAEMILPSTSACIAIIVYLYLVARPGASEYEGKYFI